MNTTKIIDDARDLGHGEGEAAASWVFNGNTSEDSYRRVLTGIQDGDPAILDELPSADLSGQWADGWTPDSLAEHLGVDRDNQWDVTEACDAYEDAFNSAVAETVETMAREHLDH